MKTNSSIRTVRFLAVALACASLLTGPSLSHAASGRIYMFTTTPAIEAGTNGLAGFLRGLGYTVTVEQDAGVDPYETLDVILTNNPAQYATLVSELTNNYDLIIVQREYGSGTLGSSATEKAIWNNLNVPLLCCNAPMLPSTKWGWIGASGQVADGFAANLGLIYSLPSHTIVDGLGTDLFKANGVLYGGYYNPGDSPNLVNIASADVSPYYPMCLGVWDENGTTQTFSATTGQTYIRRRVFFNLPDYRTAPGSFASQVSFNGRLIAGNVVSYAMTGIVPPVMTIGDFAPANGSQFNSTATTFSFQAACSVSIPTSSIHVAVNGQDVSGSLVFGGTPTIRTVSYGGLVSNEVYNISISASNTATASQASVQFDTFDYSTVQILYPDFDNTLSGPLTTNAYRLYLQIQATTPQVVSLTQSNASELPPAARLKGVFYLPGTMTAAQLIPLTDALGNQMILRVPTDTVTFIPGPLSGATLSSLYLVPVVNPPSTILPTLGKASPYPNQTGVSPLAGLNLDLINGDTAVVPGSVQLFVDSANVTASPQTTIAGTVSGANAQHLPPDFLTPSQAHSVKVVYSDNAAHTITNQYTFNTVPMPVLPPSLAVPVSAGISPGFNLLLSMAPSNTDNIWANTSARAEQQLAGTLVGPSGPVTNEISGTTSPSPYTETNVINYSYDGNPPVLSPELYPTLPGCILFPFGNLVTPGNLAVSATTWLKLPAGVVTFGVASGSGFKLTGGYDTNLLLGIYEGPRGAQVPTESQVLVYQPGLYPVRLLQYASGNAAVELYTANNANAASTSGRVLVNGADDSTTTVPVPAYSVVRPTLSIVQAGSQIAVSWYGAGNFQLKQSNQLIPAPWEAVSPVSSVVQGLAHTVYLSLPTSGNMFYRLELQ
jgi:hypothetical protein